MDRISIEQLNDKWSYEHDRVDGWTVTNRGDCDDYALTVGWIVSGHSWLRFWWNVLSFRLLFVLVTTKSGEAHIVLRWRGRYIDNISRDWNVLRGYKLRFPWVALPHVVLVKMLIGANVK